MPLRKVVITGMGAISPFGAGVEKLMHHLYAGDSAVVSMRDRASRNAPVNMRENEWASDASSVLGALGGSVSGST